MVYDVLLPRFTCATDLTMVYGLPWFMVYDASCSKVYMFAVLGLVG